MAMPIQEKIEHVVVLMLENHSFDHLFGDSPQANGLYESPAAFKPEVWNSLNPTQTTRSIRTRAGERGDCA